MKEPGARVEGRPTRVFVFEHVTGGGLAGRDLPPSWAAEGAAMRRAIVEDFAAVPGVRVVTTVDARLPIEDAPGVDVRRIADREGDWFKSLAAGADSTVLIAPETDGILAGLTRSVSRAGGLSIGANAVAVDFFGNKAWLGYFFEIEEIPSPRTRLLGRRLSRTIGTQIVDLPKEWEGPIIIKPSMGAGSVDTVVVRDHRIPTWIPRDLTFVAQPYLTGRPMSASFLVDAGRHPTLLAIGRQRIEVDAEGRVSYRGGTILAGLQECPAAVSLALAKVLSDRGQGLRGFVGVDYLLDDRGEATILEINPRPTTSYVGLVHLLHPGTIAGAWLAAANGPLEGTAWPERLRPASTGPAVSFDADGTILPPPGDVV